MEIKEILKKYNSSETGLTTALADINRTKYGNNELKKEKKKTFLVRFLLQFKNLMVLVLLFSAIVSLITNFFEPDGGSVFEAIIIFVIVILNALIGVFQERKAENAIELLQKQTMPVVSVMRNGEICKLPTTELVCGDIIEIKAGNIIPADIILIESSELKCNESSLTGESLPIDKDASDINNKNNLCFSGTYVTNGHAKGLVYAVGQNSELGKIAGLITKAKKSKTPLEKNIDQISKYITIVVTSIVCIVFLISLFSTKLGFLDSFLTAIALAVAAIPESLPAVITIIMALGVEKLAKQGAIIKSLNSVESLGCCNILCTDKTGTLTENNMQVKSIYYSSKFYSIEENIESELFYTCLCLSSNVQKTAQGLLGDATESCIYNYLSTKIDIEKIKSTKELLAEIPFNSKDKTMSSLHKVDNKKILIVKGAYDYLIKNCAYVYVNGKEIKLTDKIISALDKSHYNLASAGQRVIAYAYKHSTNITDNKKLCLVCMIGIIDPPRKEAKQAVQDLKNAHIKPIMITGDHPDTAFAIAKELGIATNRKQTITGEELNNVDDAALTKIINDYSVFARVSPQDKNRIVKVIKSQDSIVAMTGDGANDAPSIKEADIGISMASGSDVTKNVADIVITNNNISGITAAVKQGRTIYSNLRKTLQFLISTNIVEVLCIFIISIAVPNCVFLLPAQILFINLITDSLPAFALGLERPEKDIMNKLPRSRSENLFSDELGSHIIAQGFIQSLLVLIIFVITYNLYGNAIASTICFLIICYMQIIHAINCKTNKSIFRVNIVNNKAFNISFILLFLCITLVATIPPLQIIFGIVPLSLSGWLVVFAASLSIIPLVELTKIIINWLHKK